MLRHLLLVLPVCMLLAAVNTYAIEVDDAVVTTAVVDREPMIMSRCSRGRMAHYTALQGLSERRVRRLFITSGIMAKN